MTHAEFTKRWFAEVWNNQNAAAIDEMFAADGIGHGIFNDDGSPLIGPPDYRKFHKRLLTAFPDTVVTVEDTITEGDKIAVRCRVNATHCGEGIGVTPCNTPVEFTFMSIVRIENGKIAEAWNNIDFMEMYRQVGALKLELNS